MLNMYISFGWLKTSEGLKVFLLSFLLLFYTLKGSFTVSLQHAVLHTVHHQSSGLMD